MPLPDTHEKVLVGSVERGRAAESIAALTLRLAGMEILDRNRRAADGEVDLVARDGRFLVFVEVRLRRHGGRVDGATSIDLAKQGRLRRCASELLREPRFRWPDRRVRLDVVLVTPRSDGLEVEHLRSVRLAGALTRGRRRR